MIVVGLDTDTPAPAFRKFSCPALILGAEMDTE